MPVRVQMGKLPSGDYGLRVLSNDGTTVIIDGTSEMFRIVADGTLETTATAGSVADNAVTLTALGAQSVQLATLGFVGDSGSSGGVRSGGSFFAVNAGAYGASTSGGATTQRIMPLIYLAILYGNLDGDTLHVVTLSVFNYGNVSSTTNFARYFVLAQAAL